MDQLAADPGWCGDIDRLIAISNANDGTTICGMGDAAGYATVGILAKYRDKMKPFYFDSTKFKTYLEQLGIKYPVIKK